MTEKPFYDQTKLIDLSPGTGIAIWAFRSCAFGMTRCDCLPRVFSDLFGSDGPETLRHILVLAQTIGHTGQRKLNMSYPNSQRITHDEASLLRALSAAQYSKVATVEAQLHWLLAGANAATARQSVNFVARKFSDNGLAIADPYTAKKSEVTGDPADLSQRILRFVLK